MGICDESKPYIFVSYSHRDTARVIGIINTLQQKGFNVWWDDGIDPGTEWDENIAKHVKGCSYFIAFISEGYVGSKNCKDELNYSRDLDKDQLLVYLDEVALPDGMAMRMNRIQSIYWGRYKNEADAYEKLLSAAGIEVARISDSAPEGYVPNEVPESHKKLSDKLKKDKDGSVTAGKKPMDKKKMGIIAGIAIAVVAALGVLLVNVLKPSKISTGLDYLHATNNKTYDPHAALALFEEEAAKGNSEGAFLAGYVLSFSLGNTSDEDYVKAMEYFEACKNDIPYAKIAEANLYYYGYGVEKDEDLAKSLCKETLEEVNLDELKSGLVSYVAEGAELVGLSYSETYGEKKDYGEARSWYDEAIEKGDLKALAEKGYLYRKGYGTSKDYKKAFDIYMEAVNKGYYKANNSIGLLYEFGSEEVGLDKDYGQAMKYYELASEAGSYSGTNNIALLYENGRGVDQDYKTALEWHEKAAEEGNRTAMYDIGKLYYDGKLDEIDYAKALEWFEKAASLGHSDSIFCMGYIYSNGGYGVDADKNKGLEYYTKAAENGSNSALFNIGLMYENGEDGFTQDYAKAMEYYEKAAEGGYTRAMARLGYKYQTGIEGYMEPDYAKAFEYYDMGIDNGDLSDTYVLDCYTNKGVMYYNGNGLDAPDYDTAVSLYKTAAENDDCFAMVCLCRCYVYGKGVNKDASKAQEWYDKAMACKDITDAQKSTLEGYMFDLEMSSLTSEEVFNKGREYESASDFSNAWKCYKLAADKGDYDYACYIVGWLYCYGNEDWRNAGCQKDLTEGWNTYSKNSKTYYLSALSCGDWYMIADNPSYDIDKAIEWYKYTETLEGSDKEVVKSRIDNANSHR